MLQGLLVKITVFLLYIVPIIKRSLLSFFLLSQVPSICTCLNPTIVLFPSTLLPQCVQLSVQTPLSSPLPNLSPQKTVRILIQYHILRNDKGLKFNSGCIIFSLAKKRCQLVKALSPILAYSESLIHIKDYYYCYFCSYIYI